MIFQTCCVSACVVGWEVWWSWLCCVNVIVTKPSYLMIWQPIKKTSAAWERERSSGSLWADLCLIWKSWKENKGGRNLVFSFFHGSCEERKASNKSGWEREALWFVEHAVCIGTLLPWRHVTIATGAGDWGFKHISRQWKRSELPLRVLCVCVGGGWWVGVSMMGLLAHQPLTCCLATTILRSACVCVCGVVSI